MFSLISARTFTYLASSVLLQPVNEFARAGITPMVAVDLVFSAILPLYVELQKEHQYHRCALPEITSLVASIMPQFKW